MYTLLKIDLLDTNILADLFDEEKYETVAHDLRLEVVLNKAIFEFKRENKQFHSWSDWEKKAEDGGFEFEIFTDQPESIFRGSIILRDKIVENALELARKYHSGGTRKGDGLEYIIHILQITRLLYKKGFDDEIIAAAFCHDLLEDTDCKEEEIEKLCGKEVLRIVKAVSNDKELENVKDWEKKKGKYIESVLKGGEKAIAVCIADKIVNLKSLLKAYEKDGNSIWSRFNRGKEEKLWFEKSVLKMAKQSWKNPLVKEYGELVKQLEKLKKGGGESDTDAIFDWVITYKDGTKLPFRGFADSAFEYAFSKGKRFTVEKADKKEINKVLDNCSDEELKEYFKDYTDEELRALSKESKKTTKRDSGAKMTKAKAKKK